MNHQGSGSLSGNGRSESNGGRKKNGLTNLFIYIEAGNYERAAERAESHPGEAKIWVPIPVKSSSRSVVGAGNEGKPVSTKKRLPLHHACLKLRAASASTAKRSDFNLAEEDIFVVLCRLILLLIKIYPQACGENESHGCMPLHLVAFASCPGPSDSSKGSPTIAAAGTNHGAAAATAPPVLSTSNSTFSTSSLSSALPHSGSDVEAASESSPTKLPRPAAVSQNQRSVSEATVGTTMSVAIAEERFAGIQTDYQNEHNLPQQQAAGPQQQQTQSVSMGNNMFVSVERESWAVKVVNALLDEYPRAIKKTSEGGRLPLHWAAAGRATPRVVSTLITAYPDAAKQRTKAGCLPLHLCAHWGVAHSAVVVSMLRSYPHAAVGRNRWERSPLEEALAMAGENGRPHQTVMVRALRKHPSYWDQPEGVLFHQAHMPRRDTKHNIVDIDETVLSMGDSFDDDGDVDEDNLFRNDGAYRGMKPVDLPTSIFCRNWEMAAQYLESNPNQAKLNLRVVTRGGFTSVAGFTPLHSACENIPPKEIVKKLINTFPEAVSQKFVPLGKLPLHVACTWHAPKESIDIILAANRNACKIPDDLGNLPIHLACFSGAPSAVVENLLKAWPKAVLHRNSQGSLAEDITKRLKHDNRNSALALLNLCRDQVNRKRQMRHRRNRSEGHIPSTQVDTVVNTRGMPVNPIHYQIESSQSDEVEVTFSGENETMAWI